MSAGGFFCARQDDAEEEEEEELLLDSPNISRELADKVRQFNSENELVQYLAKEKPADLRFGRELEYLDTKQLDDYMSGLCLKLDIHGYEDRANRLKYLYEILRGKFSKKENVFKIVVQFLMDMAQRPTGVTHLSISSSLYSPDPEEDDTSSSNQDSEKQRLLLQEILGEDHPSNTENHYLSDSSLSDWTDDDSDPCISSKSNNSLPPNIRPIRTSSSFGEFKDICPPKAPDPLKQEMEALRFWTNEKIKAVDYLDSNIRRFETVPLSSQPVISSRLVLQARFGEWWEWKQLQKKDPPPSTPLQIAFVEDCVRELLWQFTNCRPDSSPLFNEDWTVQSDLMVASLTKSTFDGIINKYGQLFKKLQILRDFQRDIMSASLSDKWVIPSPYSSPELPDHLPPSKVYLNYSLGLHSIFIYITSKVAQIEKELLRLPRPLKEQGHPPGCSTFIQFEQQTRPLQQIIELIFNIHSKCVVSFEEDDKPWLSSLQLISTLERHLVMETRARNHGCLLFLYVKCLEALFLEILSTLRTLQWDERYSLFVRNTMVRLNDLHFWSECIKIREEFEKEFGEGEFTFGGRFTPLKSLGKLLPKVLNILKTCEVFDQLEEDFTQILEDSGDIKVECMMEEFLEETFQAIMMEGEEEEEVVLINEEIWEGEGHVDYFKHFNALGLGSSMAANCFRFLKDPKFLEATTRRKQSSKSKISKKNKGEYAFEDFLDLPRIPSKPHAMTLDKVLSKWFDPFCKSAKMKIEKIFKEFKVLECMSVFQEIILTVREDFAKGIIELASKDFKASQVYKYEDAFNRNSKFQKLLNQCYPECRDIFSIDLKLDPSSSLNCTFEVTPKFPLNLIVTPQSVAGYIFIGRQLHRIRKSLWNVSSLSLKSCCAAVVVMPSSSSGNPPRDGMGIVGEGDVQNRMLILRFCLINFCFSLRSFFMLKIFSRDFSEYANNALWERSNCGGQGEEGEMEEEHYFDLDSMRKVHENYLEVIQTEMLRHPMIENVLIRNLAHLSESLRKHWTGGMKPGTLLILEDTLQKCWRVVNDFELTKYTIDFNQLSYHFGRPPSYLTN